MNPCNPWAVHSTKQVLKIGGIKTEESLINIQKAIYNFIKSRRKVTIEEISKELNLLQKEIEIQIVILRHFELIKEQKEENKNYIVLFE
ncbi:MAG: hypothetical protein QXF09_04870 [Nitrososphaerota archaeon]